MKSTAKFKLALTLALLISVTILVQSCGNDTSVPDGSTLTVDKSSITLTTPFDVTQDIYVTARYKDGGTIPNAKIHVSGGFAYPYSYPYAYSQYQFYYYTGGPERLTDPVGNLPVDSGFDGYTNDSGVFGFSIVIYGGTEFDDTIHLNSGTASAIVTLAVTSQ